jgi:hypothetical protein
MKSKYRKKIDEKVVKTDEKRVDKFLKAEPFVAKKICELLDLAERKLQNIKKYVLEVNFDMEYRGWEVTLWLYILADMPINKIMEAEDEIDDEWYLQQDFSKLKNFNYQIYPAGKEYKIKIKRREI